MCQGWSVPNIGNGHPTLVQNWVGDHSPTTWKQWEFGPMYICATKRRPPLCIALVVQKGSLQWPILFLIKLGGVIPYGYPKEPGSFIHPRFWALALSGILAEWRFCRGGAEC